MAEATPIIETICRKNGVVLELTQDEAETLAIVCRHIAGGGRRAHMDNIRKALINADVGTEFCGASHLTSAHHFIDGKDNLKFCDIICQLAAARPRDE